MFKLELSRFKVTVSKITSPKGTLERKRLRSWTAAEFKNFQLTWVTPRMCCLFDETQEAITYSKRSKRLWIGGRSSARVIIQ